MYFECGLIASLKGNLSFGIVPLSDGRWISLTGVDDHPGNWVETMGIVTAISKSCRLQMASNNLTAMVTNQLLTEMIIQVCIQ